MNTDAEVLAAASRWRRNGLGVALATVVRTWGSAPREAGSHMAINETGEFSGSVSGGCVESAVVQAAAEVIRKGRAEHLRFGIADDVAWGVGLACGGTVEIYVERVE